MHIDIGQRLVWIAMGAAIAIAQPSMSRAFSTGIPSTVFGSAGCPLCHAGGVTPTVLLSGPTTVDPGDTADYTLTIFGTPPQTYGGLNVAANGGTLSTGGPFAIGTTGDLRPRWARRDHPPDAEAGRPLGHHRVQLQMDGAAHVHRHGDAARLGQQREPQPHQ